VDYASAKSLEVQAHERSAVKACGRYAKAHAMDMIAKIIFSGDVLSIEAGIMTIEDWLQTQPPGQLP
jgi:hypothetical protein